MEDVLTVCLDGKYGSVLLRSWARNLITPMARNKVRARGASVCRLLRNVTFEWFDLRDQIDVMLHERIV